MNTRLIRPAALAFAVSLGLAACGSEPEPAADAREAVPVRVAEAQAGPVGTAYRYSGTVEGAQRATLSSKLMGQIVSLPVEEGDRVRAGQVLVRIDQQGVAAQQAQVDAGLQEARTALANAETQFQRIEALHARESATQKEYDDAQTQLEMARARVASLEGRRAEVADVLGEATVTAPFDGVVVEKLAEAGDLAAPGRPLVTVEDVQALEVTAQVPEHDLQRFAVGDTVGVELDALGGAPLWAVVTQINPSGQAGTRQFRVRAVLGGDAARRGARPGMFARLVQTARAGTDAGGVVTVPERALVHRGQLTGLYTLTGGGGTALLRWVRTGTRYGDEVEILSGLRPGETYVVDAEGRLEDGRPVRVLR